MRIGNVNWLLTNIRHFRYYYLENQYVMKDKKSFVFAYINPDTDGVCSSIAYSNYAKQKNGKEFEPIIFGQLSSETRYVLNYFGITIPRTVDTLPSDCVIALVDTHHVAQLPSLISFQCVIEIIDHHPAGNPDKFPSAKIQNETVGAAATLLAERYQAEGVYLEKNIAGILSLAIISNTLNFKAPSTHERDRAAFTWLNSYFPIEPATIQAMFAARSDILEKPTVEIFLSDYKEFPIGNIVIGISQIESNSALEFLSRGDLLKSLSEIRQSKHVNFVFANIVDLLAQKSFLVVTDSITCRFVEEVIGEKCHNNIAVIPRILLRKTDLVPALHWFGKDS